jgi:hypothetical protein
MNIGDLVKEKELHDGWDEEYQSWNLNEDKVRCNGKAGPALCKKNLTLRGKPSFGSVSSL